MDFLSDEWLAALDQAAQAMPSVGEVEFSIGQEIVDGPSYRLELRRGLLRVVAGAARDADVWIRTDRSTATAIARGDRSALDAFIVGDAALHGDTTRLLGHRVGLEAMGDVFAAVKDATHFPSD